jgi:hypothetical protein
MFALEADHSCDVQKREAAMLYNACKLWFSRKSTAASLDTPNFFFSKAFNPSLQSSYAFWRHRQPRCSLCLNCTDDRFGHLGVAKKELANIDEESWYQLAGQQETSTANANGLPESLLCDEELTFG